MCPVLQVELSSGAAALRCPGRGPERRDRAVGGGEQRNQHPPSRQHLSLATQTGGHEETSPW